jgi:hypothetical protein
MKPNERCVFCAYTAEVKKEGRSLKTIPAPLAVEVVETPNGPRPLCARHARDAVRA